MIEVIIAAVAGTLLLLASGSGRRTAPVRVRANRKR
jgi:hypothetical protein